MNWDFVYELSVPRYVKITDACTTVCAPTPRRSLRSAAQDYAKTYDLNGGDEAECTATLVEGGRDVERIDFRVVAARGGTASAVIG